MENDDMSALLEQLRNQAGCDYISDLHDANCAWRVCAALKSIQPSDYTLNVWNSVIEYITGQRSPQAAPEAATAYLLAYFVFEDNMQC